MWLFCNLAENDLFNTFATSHSQTEYTSHIHFSGYGVYQDFGHVFTNAIGFSLPITRAILSPMASLPKPRGFWDYALFALIMTGVLFSLFWLEASDGVSWTDALFAFATAVLSVLGIVLLRRGERAIWRAQPTRSTHLIALLGALGLVFGAIYADAYLFHRRDITFSRLRHDIVFSAVLTAVILWSSQLRRPPVSTPD